MKVILFLITTFLTTASFAGECPIDTAITNAKSDISRTPGKISNFKAGGFVTTSSKFNTPEGAGDYEQEVTLVFFSYHWQPKGQIIEIEMVGNGVYFGTKCEAVYINASAVGVN